MDSPIIHQEINFLKAGYFIHILLYIILAISQFLVYLKMFWLNNHIKKIFYAEIYIICIFSLYPVILLILFTILTLSEKIIKILEIISILLLFIFIGNSLLTSISIWYNANLMKPFFHDCPFNFNSMDLHKIFSNYIFINKTIIKKKCNYRRCFSIKNQNDTYICNFKDKKREYEFNKFYLENEKLDHELVKYINYCNNYTFFYKCIRTEYKSYYSSYDIICPDKQQLFYNYLLTGLFIFSDIFASSLPWLFEFYSFKKIILLLYLERNNINHNVSLKETNNTSQIEENNNNNSNNSQGQNNDNNFERQPTEILIIDNKNNSQRISDENNENKAINIYINKNKYIQNNKNNSNLKKINTYEDNNNISKSEAQLVNNENSNIFEIINRKVKTQNDEKSKIDEM